MAITYNGLTQGSGTGSPSTASITPGANRLVLVGVQCYDQSANITTLSGNGLTYVPIFDNIAYSETTVVSLFRAMGAAPSAGAILISNTLSVHCLWHVVEFDGV